jgi:hypothetical protein
MLTGLTSTRRRFLRGLGVALALPAFESLLPRAVRAADVARQPLATTPGGAPLRTAFIYVPNGAQQDHWFPTGKGCDFQFNTSMEPLEAFKSHVQVIRGLDQQHAEAGPDGAGDHARANATFLTGCRARKTAGADIAVGTSIDQVIAAQVGEQTRFNSLELSCDAVRKSGGCDSGYSCAYQFNISWRTPTSPMTPEPNPRLVFERLFGAGDDAAGRNREQRQLERRSILDFVRDDAEALHRELGRQDRRKLDEYLAGVRTIERRIERESRFPNIPRPDLVIPNDVPEDHAAHIDLMFDLLALAFQTDSTRVATLLMAHDGSNRSFPALDISEGHHNLTHEMDQPDPREKVAKIDRFYIERLAKFLGTLQATRDIDGRSLLENSMIVYGSGIADANRHTHDNLPFILAGHGGGVLQPCQYVDAGGVPMSNLFLTLADRMGVTGLESFGDSTGRFDRI